MSANSLSVPFPIFNDIDGDPLDAGYIYIGTANLDPVTNPISVYFDEALTIPASQPIRTLNGFPSNSGSPARLYISADDYSITVKNKNGSQVYTSPVSTLAVASGAVNYTQGDTGSVQRTLTSKLQESVSVKDFGAVGDGVTDDTAAIQAALDSGAKSIFVTEGRFLITSMLSIPNETHLIGADNRRSIIYINSDINGLSIKRFVTLDNIRIVGTSSVGSDKGLILLGFTGDSPHTRFYNVTIGGQDTLFGDPVTQSCGGNGIIGGNTFLNQFYSCFFYKCYRGYWNTSTSGSVEASAPANNAMLFSGCSFSSNTVVGVSADLLQGVVFDNCDFENNGNFACSITDTRNTKFEGCYFENNGHATTIGVPNADIRTTQGVGGTISLSIKDCFFLRGYANMTRGLDIDSQRNVEVSGCYFNNYSVTGVLAIEATNATTGKIENCFTTGPDNVQNYSLASTIAYRELYSTQSNGNLQNPVEPKLLDLKKGFKQQVYKIVTSTANINYQINLDNYQVITCNNQAGYDVYVYVPDPATNVGRQFTVIKDSTNTTNNMIVYSPAGYPIVGSSGSLQASADGTALTMISDGTSWVCFRSEV